MAKIQCQRCGKTMEDTQYYTYKTGEKTEMCKACLTAHIDIFDESSYLWLFEKMDVPNIPGIWNTIVNKDVTAKGKKVSPTAIFGKYISQMKLKQYKQYGWADSEEAQRMYGEKNAADAQQQAEMDQFYQEQYEKGEISEAEYKTLTSAQAQFENARPDAAALGLNAFPDSQFMDESELTDYGAQLTQEDKLYLAMKWGRLYKPSEWVELEKMYDDMMASFDIQDADSKSTLILLCKTTLKQNQCIDASDIEGFQKLSKVSESLRKTAKFTAAQNKEEKGDYVDSIGELVRICEQDGFIPRFCTEVPQDKVDATLKDQKAYIKKLVTEDLGFGAQIEDALKRIVAQAEEDQTHADSAAAANEDDDDYAIELKDDEMAEFFEEQNRQREIDASIGDDDDAII